jgi:hypothetical protein
LLSLSYQAESFPATKNSISDDSSENYGFYEMFGMKVNDKDFLPIFFGIPPSNDETTTRKAVIASPAISQKRLTGKN